jgi:uracil-DNA glycosylase
MTQLIWAHRVLNEGVPPNRRYHVPGSLSSRVVAEKAPDKLPGGHGKEKDGEVVMIGQAPSKTTDGLAPFSGRSGRRIASWAGLTPSELAERFELRNLIDRWPGKAGKGDKFYTPKIFEVAAEMKKELVGRRVVCVGLAVARAFSPSVKIVRYRFRDVDGVSFASIPHPSGVNVVLNDPDELRRTVRFVRGLM